MQSASPVATAVGDCFGIDSGQFRIEPVKRLLWVYIGEETVDYFAILYYGNADGTHSIVVSVRRLNVEYYVFGHMLIL